MALQRCNLHSWLQGHLKHFLENYHFFENLEMTGLAGGGSIMLKKTVGKTVCFDKCPFS